MYPQAIFEIYLCVIYTYNTKKLGCVKNGKKCEDKREVDRC